MTATNACMVLDEMDAAAAKMTPRAEEKTSTKPTQGSAVAAKDNPILEQSKRWWREATSLAPGAIDSKIVNCQLRRGKQFMAKDDCLSRGGRALDAAG